MSQGASAAQAIAPWQVLGMFATRKEEVSLAQLINASCSTPFQIALLLSISVSWLLSFVCLSLNRLASVTCVHSSFTLA